MLMQGPVALVTLVCVLLLALEQILFAHDLAPLTSLHV